MADAVPFVVTPADGLVLVADVVATLKVHGFIVAGPDGHYAFARPSTGEIVSEATDVEALLVAHGLQVPPKIDKIIKLLPLIIEAFGL